MPGLNHLFSKLTLKMIRKPLENLSSEEIKMFSEELTDKVYDHIQSIYPTRRMQMGKSLSESDISKSSQRDCGVPFSPEMLYVLVQESVEKFYKTSFFG